MNIKTFIGRHRGETVFGLTILIIVLLVGSGWKHGIVSATWLAAQKDPLSALNSILTMVLLLAGAAFSYYRFFRGRTLSLRAELSLDVTIHKAIGNELLHSVTLVMKNVGTSTIWNPYPRIDFELYNKNGSRDVISITEWWEESTMKRRETSSVVESTETVTFFALRWIDESFYAVTYRAQVSADSGDIWYCAKTVSNLLSGKAS